MAGRVEVLQFLQDSAALLRRLAEQHAAAVTPELTRLVEDIEREANELAEDLQHDGALSTQSR